MVGLVVAVLVIAVLVVVVLGGVAAVSVVVQFSAVLAVVLQLLEQV